MPVVCFAPGVIKAHSFLLGHVFVYGSVLVQAKSSPLLVDSYEDVPWSALVHLAAVHWPSFPFEF